MYLYKWEKGLKAYFQNQTEEAIRLYIADGYVLGEVYNNARTESDPELSAEEASRDFFRAVIEEVFLVNDLPVHNNGIRIVEIAKRVKDWQLLPLCVFFAAVWAYEYEFKKKSDRNYRDRFVKAIGWGLERTYEQIHVDFDARVRYISKENGIVKISFAYAAAYFSNGIISLFSKLSNQVKTHWGKNLYMLVENGEYGTSPADGITISHSIFRYGEIRRVYRIFSKQKLRPDERYSRALFEYLVRNCFPDNWMIERNVNIDELTDAVQKLFLAWDGTSIEDTGTENQDIDIKDLPEDVNLKKKARLLPIKLGLHPTKNGWMKRVFVEANPNEEFVGQLKDLTIRSQNVMLCPINQLLEVRSVRNNHEDINEIWNELAVASYEDDIFSFQNGKYYILMRQGLRLMLQQDSFIENKPFTILYKTCEVKKIEEWFNNHGIEVVQNQTVDDQWGIVSINGCTLQQWQHLSGEALSKTKKVSDIKLRYGIKSSSSEREYLPDFLPDVEAYLPGKFSVEILTNLVNNNENLVYIKQIENVENCESSNLDYCWRSFSITLNSSEVQTINVCFKNEDNEEIGSKVIKVFREKKCDMAIPSDEGKYTLDKYGELSIGNVPEDIQCCRQECVDGDIQAYNGVVYDEALDHWDSYWKFLEAFQSVHQGERGVCGREFWRLWGYYFYGQPQWRTRVNQLFALGVLDIYSLEDGLWASFRPNQAQLCLLPYVKNGKYTILLTGGFSKEILGRFISSAKEKGLTVEVARQRFSLNECHCSPFVLPPRVIAYCSEVNQAEELAEKLRIRFVGVLADSYVLKGATLQEWRDSIRSAGVTSDGMNAPTPVYGWFSLFDYAMEKCKDEKYDVPSPLEISEFFSPCIRKRSRDYDNYHSTYELIDKKEGMLYPIQDCSWARWAMYDLSQKGADFQGKKFKIAYDGKHGAMILPVALKLPKIFSRAAVLCSGWIPAHIDSCAPYDTVDTESNESEYGLSMRPYENKDACVVYFEVPRCIANKIAEKLSAELKEYSIEK